MSTNKTMNNKSVSVPMSVIEDICKYCEHQAVYDKLSNYGDFYYKLKRLTANT